MATQWDPNTAVDWTVEFELPHEVEDAVVQVMTYLIENETAALIIPARFASRIHPHFREVMQVLAIQAAGSWTSEDIGRGFDRVVGLRQEMDSGRRKRLERLGVPLSEAKELSGLHTRNFM